MSKRHKCTGTIQEPGTKVSKFTGKPFKSHRKVNTVKGVVEHPILGTPAFTFEEDDSVVDVRMCRPATTTELLIYERHFGAV